MTWKDLQARFRGLFRGRAEISSRGPDGVTNCYQPVVRRDMREEELAREKAAAYYAAQPQPAYAHTGFTGMNPPMTGMSPVQSMVATRLEPP